MKGDAASRVLIQPHAQHGCENIALERLSAHTKGASAHAEAADFGEPMNRLQGADDEKLKTKMKSRADDQAQTKAKVETRRAARA